MKNMQIFFLIVMMIFLTAATFLPPPTEIEWWNIGGSGNYVSVGDLEMDGVVGQGIIGFSSQSAIDLCSGFLCTLERLRLLLPIILKSTP